MKRVVILGRGAAGKSTLAARLGEQTGLPVIELDQLFWQADLTPLPREKWIEVQRELTERDEWILDGELGPNDTLDVRLQAADTVVVMDFSLVRCIWRAIQRSGERPDFWVWLWTYRRRHLPSLMKAISSNAPGAQVHILRTPRDVTGLLHSSARR